MPELVEDLRDAQRDGQVEPVAGGEKLVKVGQLRTEDVEVHEHEHDGAGDEAHRQHDRPRLEEPAEPRVKLLEQPVGIDAPKPHRHDVRQPRHPLLPDPLPPPLVELGPLPRPIAHDQAAAVERGHEPGQLVERDPTRRKAGLELLLELFEAGLPVEHVEEGVFLGTETEIGERDRILHHPPGLPLVHLTVRDEVATAAQADRPRGARTKGVSGGHNESCGGAAAEYVRGAAYASLMWRQVFNLPNPAQSTTR